MIPVARPKRPRAFTERCTRRGEAWLAAHPLDAKGGGPEPRDYWSAFEADLRRAFSERCGWLAMWIACGQVEHYLSKHPPDPKRRRKQRRLAYAWRNLRYADASVNLRKGVHDEAVLDPYEVGDGWFALDAALELEVTAACPTVERKRADFTLDTLGLRRGTVAMRLRRQYLHEYATSVAHGMDATAALALLDAKAPQLAAYVRAAP